MPTREHNPHKRRLYLPIVGTNGQSHDEPHDSAPIGYGNLLADTHEAHSVGCAQTARPAGRRPEWLRVKARIGPNYAELKRIMRTQSLHTVCE
jgi:hypothetical protein